MTAAHPDTPFQCEYPPPERIHHNLNIGCSSITTPLKMGKTKILIFYSHSLLELCYVCILSAGFVKKYYHIISLASYGELHPL